MVNLKTLILPRKEIEKFVDIRKAISCVEQAFAEYAAGRASMPAKIYLNLPKYDGDFRAMPAHMERINRACLKWVNAHPKNKDLPSVMAVVILNDPKTGFPLCIMDGTYLTSLRTGAAGAVAVKYLARKGSATIGFVGCGVQAQFQLLAIRETLKIKKVKVWGKAGGEAKKFIQRMQKQGEYMEVAKTIRHCVADSDIVVTSTPSRKPIVFRRWISNGTHINAIGADAKGKQELDPGILRKAIIIVDDRHQALNSGEVNVPLSKRQLSEKDIYATLGDIVSGKKKGRCTQEDITVFDSTGLAIQDVAVAGLVYQLAKKRRVGHPVQMI